MNMSMKNEKQKELNEMYEKWQKQIGSSFLEDGYSHPYFVGVPENWFDKDVRIMIVGEEGAGTVKNPGSVEDIQTDNLLFLKSQIEKGNQDKKQPGAFWRWVRKIVEEFPDVAICWNNIDKIHVLRKGNGALTPADRKKIHDTEIHVLREEINILNPTHIVFFGWHDASLQAELPEVYDKVYPNGDKSLWKDQKMFSDKMNGKYYIFSGHPSWKTNAYRDDVLELIKDAMIGYKKNMEEN